MEMEQNNKDKLICVAPLTVAGFLVVSFKLSTCHATLLLVGLTAKEFHTNYHSKVELITSP